MRVPHLFLKDGRGAPRKQRPEGQELGGQGLLFECIGFGPDDDHNIEPGRKELWMEAEDLAHKAFAAVSLDGSANLLGRDDAKPGLARRCFWAMRVRRLGRLRGQQDEQVLGANAGARVLNADEVGAFADAPRA